MTILSSDGFSVEPIVVDSFVCGAGERFDFSFDATPDDPETSRYQTLSFICHFVLLTAILISDEAIITVRGIDLCAGFQMQEFARIIFRDDITNYQTQPDDYAPLAVWPAYGSVNPGSVSLLISHHIFMGSKYLNSIISDAE